MTLLLIVIGESEIACIYIYAKHQKWQNMWYTKFREHPAESLEQQPLLAILGQQHCANLVQAELLFLVNW